MTTENLYEALETCLNALEQGADIESCLARFPGLEGDLRPILETAYQMRAMAVETVPVAAQRRGKARVLQVAAEMREQQRKAWVFPFVGRRSSTGRSFRLAFTTVAMLLFLLTGGTGLVNASSGSLPGDGLYPVKRSWEDFRLLLAFNPELREELEDEFEQERVREIDDLFSEKRVEAVTFQGVVERQEGEYWIVNGIKLKADAGEVSGVVPGAVVQITGETDDGLIEASRINLLATPQATYTPNPSVESDLNGPTETEAADDDESATPAPTKLPQTEAPEATEAEDEQETTPTMTPASSSRGNLEPTKTPKASKPGSNDNNSGSGSNQDGNDNSDDNGGDNGNDDDGNDDDNNDSNSNDSGNGND